MKNPPNIVQIIPCNHNLYEIGKNGDGSEWENRVLIYALCDDGIVYPVAFDEECGVDPIPMMRANIDRYELQDGEICIKTEGNNDL